MPTHRHTIGQCQCGAYLCCQSNDGDYEGLAYWKGGDPHCLHAIEGCEFDQLNEFDLKNYTMRMFAQAAGLGFARGGEG